MKPNFFMVGTAKAGSTSLVSYLRGHPNVFMSTPKEPHYFASDLPGLQVVDDLPSYLALYQEANETHRIVGECSNFYLYSKTAAAGIREFNPDAKIVVTLRNPIDMVHSAHAQFLHLRDETIVDFTEAWLACEARRAGRLVPSKTRSAHLLLYDQIALYAEQLKRLYAYFPADQVHLVVFDDLVADTPGVYRRLLKFLELPDDGRTEFPLQNRNRRHRSLFIGEWSMHPPAKLVAAANLLKRVAGIEKLNFLRKIRQANDIVEPRQPIPAAIRTQIQATYAKDVRELSTLTNLPLDKRWLC